MKFCCDLKACFFVFSFLITVDGNTFANEVDSSAAMPEFCKNIALEQLTFELPLPIEQFTKKQQDKIRTVIEDTSNQSCILQMQYDGLIQELITMLFENMVVSDEQLKSFYQRLSSLSQYKTENKLKAILAIRKIVSDSEWKVLTSVYTHSFVIKNEFINQQLKLQQSYDVLINGNKTSEFKTFSLMLEFLCVKNSPKFQKLEQIISTFSLENIQEGQVRDITRLYERQSCSAYQDILKSTGQLLQVMTLKSDPLQTKQNQVIFNQLFSKEYLREVAQIKKISSMFQILTSEQKKQLQEKYILLKGIL